MPQLLRDFLQELDNLKGEISRLKSHRLDSIKKRQKVQALVDNYFRNIRPAVATIGEVGELLTTADALAQELLELSHKRSLIKNIKKTLGSLKKTLIDLEIKATCNVNNEDSPISLLDSLIIETLDGLITSASLSYRQALEDLADDKRKSFRGPAADLREALRETLDHLAPDVEVMSQPGFRPEPDAKAPTMKQKVRYILSHRGLSRSLSETAEKATESIETTIGSFVRSVYVRSSISTHTATNRDEVLRIRDWVRVVLCELLALRVP